jgi:Cu2+-containing amine oxidase
MMLAKQRKKLRNCRTQETDRYRLTAFGFVICFRGFELIDFSIVAELPPPPEPFDPLSNSEMKKAIEIINIAESIVDEVVNKLLNEAAEKVLKEE